MAICTTKKKHFSTITTNIFLFYVQIFFILFYFFLGGGPVTSILTFFLEFSQNALEYIYWDIGHLEIKKNLFKISGSKISQLDTSKLPEVLVYRKHLPKQIYQTSNIIYISPLLKCPVLPIVGEYLYLLLEVHRSVWGAVCVLSMSWI